MFLSRLSIACACAAALIISVVPAAHAAPGDEEPVSLAWSAPKECPSEADVTARTAARLPPTTRVAARGRVDKAGGRYKLVLEIASKGERTLEATTCDALASSAAVVLAMSVAPPKEKEEEPPPGPDPAPAEAPPPVTTAVRPPDRERVERRPAPVFGTKLGVRLHAIGDAGTLPAIGAGGGLAFGIDPLTRLHLEVTGNLWAKQEGTLATDVSRGAAFQLVTAGARGCWVLTRPVTLAPCLGAEIVIVSGSGFGANRTSEATWVTWAPDAALMLGVPLSERIALRAGLGATAPISRQTFVIASGGEVHRAAPVVLRGWIGPEVVF